MIWITSDREFIDDSQPQNRKDFMIGLQKWAPSVQNNKSGGPNLQTPAIMTSQRQSPASGLPLRRH